MKRILIAASLALALPLASCGPQLTINSASNTITKSVTAANDLYKAASKAGESLVILGQLDKAKYKVADAKAYAVLVQFRAGTATAQQLAMAVAAITGDTK